MTVGAWLLATQPATDEPATYEENGTAGQKVSMFSAKMHPMYATGGMPATNVKCKKTLLSIGAVPRT